MLDRENLKSLMKTTMLADKSKPTSYSWGDKQFSYEVLNETLRKELNEYTGSYALYRENKNLIFSVLEETIDEVLPKKVEERYEQFAETRVYGNNDRVQFRRPLNTRARAKQFITRVGLNGVYEVFKLGKNVDEAFEVRTSAIGGGVQIGFEEFLDGRVDWAEVTEVLYEGMDELLYKEVAAALKASINQLPPANRVASNGFDEEAFDGLVNIAKAYGEPTIYCTYEFAVKMIPQEAWRYTEAMKDELWRTGRFATYKGTKVVILEQGFEDGTNTTKVIDPGYVWIIPSNANGKPVKIAFQGPTIMNEVENQDQTRELRVYKKVGVMALLSNDICCYVDTALLGQMQTWNFNGYKTVYDYGTAPREDA